MKSKSEIVKDWLPRYTGRPLKAFGEYILLTNFAHYVELFAERFGVEVVGRDMPMQSATAENVTIINFGMGSAMAATVMDLLSAVAPKAVLFLGKCGGLKKTNAECHDILHFGARVLATLAHARLSWGDLSRGFSASSAF